MRRPSVHSIAVVATVVSLVMAAAACQPAAPALTEPKEIVTKAVDALQHAKSVHVGMTATGSITLGGLTAGALSLEQTKLDGDIDIANAELKATFQVPSLLALSGEVIVADGVAYLKTSLTGPKYTKLPLAAAAAGSSPAPSPEQSARIAALTAFLDRPGVDPTKEADAKCGLKDCYQVSIELTPDELAAMSSAAPSLPLPSLPIDLSGMTVTLTFGVEKGPVRLATLGIAASNGTTVSITATATFENWDAGLSIQAPPADQIGDGKGLGALGGLLPFPIPSGLLP